MLVFTPTVVVVAAAAEESDPMGYIILAVGIGLAAFVSSLIFRRRNRATKEAATGGNAEVFAFVIAPAPPLDVQLADVRAVVAEASPEPKITRYSRIVVTADAGALVLKEKKAGPLVTIPAADIVSLESRPATIKPGGTIVPRTWPAVWVSVRRGDAEATIAFVPIVGAYDKVTPEAAQQLVNELATRLGLARV